MSKKEAYIEKLQAQLDEWDAEIKKLNAKAAKAQADAKLEYHEQIDRIRLQQQEARAKMDELRQSSEDAWEDLVAGMERAWDSLGKAVRSAMSRFK
jgi:chromosome segregation ATPase